MSLIKWDPFREFNALPARLAFWGKWGKDWGRATVDDNVCSFCRHF